MASDEMEVREPEVEGSRGETRTVRRAREGERIWNWSFRGTVRKGVLLG